tara:strand:+ start:469 stop:876 length:408 start_codon:yes stop_codon:yes gene_type:complete
MKVLRSKEQLIYNAEKPNLKAYVYLRIASHNTNFLTGYHNIVNQYYRLDTGNIYLLRAENNVFTKDEFENLRSTQLIGDLAHLDSLEHTLHHQALYIGALGLIEVGGIYGTLPTDWEVVDVDQEIHSSSVILPNT